MFFINIGLPPSSFCSALLRQDRDEAFRRAHPNIRNDETIDQMLRFVAETVPVELFRTEEEIEAWSVHNGLGAAEEKIWVLFKLRFPDFN